MLEAGEFSGAYYLAGYAVECGLKACIAKQTKQFDFPDRNSANASHTHNLDDLIRLANLKIELKRLEIERPQLQPNWLEAKNWSEQSRYARYTERAAADLLEAVSSLPDGVVPWIEQFW